MGICNQWITREEFLQITVICDDGKVFVNQLYSYVAITDPN